MRNPVILMYKLYLIILFTISAIILLQLDLIGPVIFLLLVLTLFLLYFLDPYGGPATQYIFSKNSMEALTKKLNELGYQLSKDAHDHVLFVKDPDRFWKKKVIAIKYLGSKLEVNVSSRTPERKELDRFIAENTGVLG